MKKVQDEFSGPICHSIHVTFTLNNIKGNDNTQNLDSIFQLFLFLYFDYAVTVVPFFFLSHPSLQQSTPFSSCPWFVHVSSLASPLPILFLTSPCLFCSYPLCFLIPAPFSPFFPFPLPVDNPPNDPHTCDSVPVLVVCLVCFCFLGLAVDSCEFVILMFIVLIFFLLNKSL